MTAADARLVDRAALHDLVARYAHSVDGRDIPGIISCFTPDAHVDFDGGTGTAEGHDGLDAFFTTAFASEMLGGSSGTSTHLLTDVLVTFLGDDRAHTETIALSCLASESRGTVLLRGLRYSDDCVRAAEGWLVERRLHQSTWQCEAPGGPVGRPSA